MLDCISLEIFRCLIVYHLRSSDLNIDRMFFDLQLIEVHYILTSIFHVRHLQVLQFTWYIFITSFCRYVYKLYTYILLCLLTMAKSYLYQTSRIFVDNRFHFFLRGLFIIIIYSDFILMKNVLYLLFVFPYCL